MNEEWILETKETRRAFSNAAWVCLRTSIEDNKGDLKEIGHVSEYFGRGSVAFPPKHRVFVEERLGWGDIGIGHRSPRMRAKMDIIRQSININIDK